MIEGSDVVLNLGSWPTSKCEIELDWALTGEPAHQLFGGAAAV
jgi:hypothetical protein